MIADKEFQKYSEGIFKPYFEKFIEFKRSKGEKVGHSALVRMKALNDELNSYGVLCITKEITEEILAPKDGISKQYKIYTYFFLKAVFTLHEYPWDRMLPNPLPVHEINSL